MSRLGLFLFLLSGCAHAKSVCTVVDMAHKACTLLRYIDEQGQVRSVRLTADEVRAIGRHGLCLPPQGKTP